MQSYLRELYIPPSTLTSFTPRSSLYSSSICLNANSHSALYVGEHILNMLDVFLPATTTQPLADHAGISQRIVFRSTHIHVVIDELNVFIERVS